MVRRWNPKSLLEALMALLKSDQVVVTRGRLRKEHGNALYKRDPATGELRDMKIVIDPRNAPTVTILIHELLHLHMASLHKIDVVFNDILEEAMVRAITEELEKYLNAPKREKLMAQWIKATDQKLS